MSDELVKRLRGWDHCWPARWLERAVAEAADRIETLTAQLESTLKDRAAIIAERDRTFALMLARAEKAELERDALREDVEELDFLRHEGGPDSVAAIEADNARLREAGEKAICHITGYGEASTARIELRAALKGETP